MYAPEAGITSDPMTPEDCLRALGLSELQGTLSGGAEGGGGGTTLGDALVTLCELRGRELARSADEGRVPESTGRTTAAEDLSRRLEAAQAVYDEKVTETRAGGDGGGSGVEEKILAFQKECSERLTEQMRRDMERFRGHELEMMRLEERGR